LIFKVQGSSPVKVEAAGNISEEPVATSFRVEYSSTLKIEEAGFFEMLVTIYQTTSHPRRW
jgi:hypothetical protein